MALEYFKGTQAECNAVIAKANIAMGYSSGTSIDVPVALDENNDIYECLIDGNTQKNSLSSSERTKVLSTRDDEMLFLKREKEYKSHIEGRVTYTKVSTINLSSNPSRYRGGERVTFTASTSDNATEKSKFIFDTKSWTESGFTLVSTTNTSITVNVPLKRGNYTVYVMSSGFGGKRQSFTIRI